MTKTIGLLALAIAATAATPALAQNEREEHFDGPYISGTFGLSAFSNDTDGPTVEFDTNRDGTFGDPVLTTLGADAFAPGFCNGPSTGSAPACTGKDDDWEFSGRLGYDKRMGNLVVGALIEGSKSNATDGASAFSVTPAGYSFSRELDYAISARAKLGYTPNGGALFYVTGGPSYAKIKHGFSTTNTANSFTPVDDDDMTWGWQAGGGVEVMVLDNVSIGFEYLYNRYNDNKYHVAVGQGTADPLTNPFLLNGGGTNARPTDTRYDFHSLRTSISLRF